MIIVLKGCRREIEQLPEEVRGDLADALARLDAGLMLSMPVSRPMPSIGRGVHELRLRDRSGTYRIVYAMIDCGLFTKTLDDSIDDFAGVYEFDEVFSTSQLRDRVGRR